MAKILLIQGHPNKASLCNALALAYCEASKGKGHQIELLNLGELKFDPILRLGFNGDQTLEADLQHAQAKILWADHIVWVYPNWWGSFPALLKGFIDRVFLPGFAFRYQKGKALPEQLLKGRTAELIVTLDTPPWFYRFLLRAPGLKMMQSAVLGFCGIKVRGVELVGPVRGASSLQRQKWLATIQKRAQVFAQ